MNCVWGGSVPHLREGVELGGRVWYLQKARRDGHNMSIENEMLSLSVYEPIALQILLGAVLEFGGRG